MSGSIRWGIDHGRAFDVEGIYRYGYNFTDCDSHAEAAELAVIHGCPWNDETFDFITPEVLTVWRIGPRHDYMRTQRIDFTVSRGQVQEVAQ
jgi:hypothetical protein